jgi:hypothetical protein
VENSDCGIAASAHVGERDEKIQYGLEIYREFPFFSVRAPMQARNWVLAWLAGLENLNFIAEWQNWQN